MWLMWLFWVNIILYCNFLAGNGENNETPPWQRQLLSLLYRINETLDKNEDRMDDHERKDILKLEWQQAALVIDR